MAVRKVFFPVYETGDDGKKAYEFIEVTGVLVKGPGKTVPEGEACVNSRSMTSTPPADIQPRGNH